MEHILQSVNIVIPIILILIFGFFAAKRHVFHDNHHAITTMSKLVLNVTLPAALFAGTITISVSELPHAFLLFLALLICTLIVYFIGFFIAKTVFKRNITQSVIAGLGASFSSGPFYGPALLGSIYGNSSTIAISMIALVINLGLVPLATIQIEIDLEKRDENKQHHHIPLYQLILRSMMNAILKSPYVWAPLLAIILLLLGVKAPNILINSCHLIGQATSGVAVFVAGMTIAVNQFKFTSECILFALFKDIGLPVVFFLCAPLFMLQHGSIMFNEGLLLSAMPSGPMIILLANQYKQYQQEAASILAISTISMIVTVSVLITFLH